MSRLRILKIPSRVVPGSSNGLHTTVVANKDKLDLSFNDHEYVKHIHLYMYKLDWRSTMSSPWIGILFFWFKFDSEQDRDV